MRLRTMRAVGVLSLLSSGLWILSAAGKVFDPAETSRALAPFAEVAGVDTLTALRGLVFIEALVGFWGLFMPSDRTAHGLGMATASMMLAFHAIRARALPAGWGCGCGLQYWLGNTWPGWATAGILLLLHATSLWIGRGLGRHPERRDAADSVLLHTGTRRPSQRADWRGASPIRAAGNLQVEPGSMEDAR